MWIRVKYNSFLLICSNANKCGKAKLMIFFVSFTLRRLCSFPVLHQSTDFIQWVRRKFTCAWTLWLHTCQGRVAKSFSLIDFFHFLTQFSRSHFHPIPSGVNKNWICHQSAWGREISLCNIYTCNIFFHYVLVLLCFIMLSFRSYSTSWWIQK